jgi:hypothetical protein
MGSILGCRTGALAMAAGLSVGRSPFLRVDTKGEAKERNLSILRERAKLFEMCGNSDHAMLAGAFMKWDTLPVGGGERKRYCDPWTNLEWNERHLATSEAIRFVAVRIGIPAFEGVG